MSHFKISVITVVYNDKEGLERTIKSVISQTFNNIEYIIIDGGSTDGTVEVIKRNQGKISKWISEPDKGIYDAMNKGIRMASGEWLNFMNAGDTFADVNVLEKVFKINIPDSISFIYSDIYSINKGTPILRQMNFSKCIMIHQCVIYRKSLHEEHGLYVVTPKIIISDFLFFSRIPDNQVLKIKPVIAIFEGGGISAQGNWAQQQAYCLDVIFRRRSYWEMVIAYGWKRIKALIPTNLKDFIKGVMGVNYKG